MSYTCKDAILAALAANGPMDYTELRTECATQATDYSLHQFVASLYELGIYGKITVTEEEPNEDTGGVFHRIYELA